MSQRSGRPPFVMSKRQPPSRRAVSDDMIGKVSTTLEKDS